MESAGRIELVFDAEATRGVSYTVLYWNLGISKSKVPSGTLSQTLKLVCFSATSPRHVDRPSQLLSGWFERRKLITFITRFRLQHVQ